MLIHVYNFFSRIHANSWPFHPLRTPYGRARCNLLPSSELPYDELLTLMDA